MAYVDIGDYRYTDIGSGQAQVYVIDRTKTSYEDNILSQVSIDDQVYTVTSMYESFRNCINFNQSITIPDSVTDMSYCFYGCTNFNQPITIPNSVINMSRCFRNCTNFNSLVTFSDKASVASMIYCFSDCTSFNQPIIIPDKVTDMDYCFYGCISFNSLVTFSDKAQVTDMSRCFFNCINFNQPVTIPNGVEDMTGCFYHCINFNQPITIPDSVTNMVLCFYRCSALANNIIIKNLPTYNTGDIFTLTGQPIYIINGADESIKDQAAILWREVASVYENVHYELDDHPAPLIKLEAKRVDEEGRPDSTSKRVQITKTIIIYQDFIPYDYEPAMKYSETLTINGTPVAVPEKSGIYLLDNETYDQKQTILYTLNDRYREVSTTAVISRLIALLDFQGYGGKYYDDEPGMGMAIGKIAERNGLEIKFPTAIGTGLIPATKFEYNPIVEPSGNPSEEGWYERSGSTEPYTYTLTEDTTVISGKTYYEQKEYVDLDSIQLLIGQFNEITNNNTDNLFIIGNGTDDNNRNNALVISKSPPYVYVDKQAAWRTALGLSDSTLTMTATDGTSFTTQMVHLT